MLFESFRMCMKVCALVKIYTGQRILSVLLCHSLPDFLGVLSEPREDYAGSQQAPMIPAPLSSHAARVAGMCAATPCFYAGSGALKSGEPSP